MATKEQNSNFAKWMRAHPNQYPDSISKGGWRGEGANHRDYGKRLTPSPCDNARWMFGFMGGVLAFKAGLSSINPENM